MSITEEAREARSFSLIASANIIALAVLAALAATVFGVGTASAHPPTNPDGSYIGSPADRSGWGSVDWQSFGEHYQLNFRDFRTDSYYTNAIPYAVNQWNYYKDYWGYDTGVYIGADTAATSADLDLDDYSAPDGSAAITSFATTRDSTDLMKFNMYYAPNYTGFQKKQVATHEFGHALGFGHPGGVNTSASLPYKTTALMYWQPLATSFSTPQSHDIADYKCSWIDYKYPCY